MAEIISRPKVRLATQEDENGDRYFIDTTTRNLSFLQTSADLSRLGIKNNKFFLALYDRVLQGVDPFSPSLSNELKQRIGLECWNNMWYFLRECVRIPSQGGATGPGAGDPFLLHRANLAAAWCFHRCQDFYLVIPRQCFKTFSVLAMFLWAYLFGTSNTTFNFVSKSQPDADANLDKLKQEKEILPLFLQHKYKIETVEVGLSKEEKQIFGTNNVRRIRNPITNNTIDAKPSARTEAAADALGRGNSAPMQYYDEVEFTPFIGTILQASGPAYYQAAMNSKRNNAIYCRVITSTPKHFWENV